MTLAHLFANNRAWARRMTRQDPAFFTTLAKQQSPRYLWIGCSDSRVPANEIVGLLPGELFVHRNVANLVVPKDTNCLSVIQYAVDVLRVGHIIVCGHYGCGGVQTVMRKGNSGLITEWLRPLSGIADQFTGELETLTTEQERADKLCELNVVEQVRHVCQSAIVRQAWQRRQRLAVHGWVYSLNDGLLKDLLKKPVTTSAQKGLIRSSTGAPDNR